MSIHSTTSHDFIMNTFAALHRTKNTGIWGWQLRAVRGPMYRTNQ